MSCTFLQHIRFQCQLPLLGRFLGVIQRADAKCWAWSYVSRGGWNELPLSTPPPQKKGKYWLHGELKKDDINLTLLSNIEKILFLLRTERALTCVEGCILTPFWLSAGDTNGNRVVDAIGVWEGGCKQGIRIWSISHIMMESL